MKDYQQRILSAIGDFQRGERKARRKAKGLFGKNRPCCGQSEHIRQIKNQEVVK